VRISLFLGTLYLFCSTKPPFSTTINSKQDEDTLYSIKGDDYFTVSQASALGEQYGIALGRGSTDMISSDNKKARDANGLNDWSELW